MDLTTPSSLARIPIARTAHRFAFACAVITGLLELTIVLYAAGRGLDPLDESYYIYSLSHPEPNSFTADHVLWSYIGAPLGDSIYAYRLLAVGAILLVSVLFLLASLHYLRKHGCRLGGADILWIGALAMNGALLNFAYHRTTMHYTYSAVLAGALIAIALLLDQSGLFPKARQFFIITLIATGLTLMAAARFPAAVLIALLLLPYFICFCPERPISHNLVLYVTALVASFVIMLASGLLGIDWFGLMSSMFALSEAAGRRPLMIIADIVYKGAPVFILSGAFVIGFIVVYKVLKRCEMWNDMVGALLIMGFALFACMGVVWWKWENFSSDAQVSDDPFCELQAVCKTSVEKTIFGFGYAIFVIVFGLLMLCAYLMWKRRAASMSWWWRQRVHPVVFMPTILLSAAIIPFAATGAPIWGASGSNGFPLMLLLGLSLWYCGDRLRIAERRAVTLAAVPVCLLISALVGINNLTQPVRVNGDTFQQTVALEEPAVLRGLLVSPPVAKLARNLNHALERLGFDAERDKVIAGYNLPGLVVLSGAGSFGDVRYFDPKWQPEDKLDTFNCFSARRFAARHGGDLNRVFGLNVEDYSHEFMQCLQGIGFELDRAEVVTAGPHLSISVIPMSLRGTSPREGGTERMSVAGREQCVSGAPRWALERW